MTKVILHTEQNAEDNCMLQALYSRSADSVTQHLDKLADVGSGKFMEQYYLNYGHASIADCGTITIYIEGVSMLAAKAIQDNPLYNGQESSSRYIDWSSQPFYDPIKTEETKELLEMYRDFYVTQKPVLVDFLGSIYPKKKDEKQSVYDKAILAKAFDILRGFLPCGATTNLSWSTTLRKANEHLAYLALHPLSEVRDLALDIHDKLHEAYPNSIQEGLPYYNLSDDYLTDERNYYQFNGNVKLGAFVPVQPEDFLVYEISRSDTELKDSYVEKINNRPKRAGLPKFDPYFQTRVKVETLLDFGSYRDLQRHRNGYCGVPIITDGYGFHTWYFDQLPDESKDAAVNLFKKIDAVTEHIHDLEKQYLLPMGALVRLELDYNLHQLLYVAELRSSQTVHATLRPIAQEMGRYFEDAGIKTYCDFSADAWTLRRGTQDITEKA